mmetsp:Transcript_16782/g.26027  ORF Transcript_16782/g.26027 Transcript_16782/m.26027 type:complete len:202 (-) Transcript_16782:623-1228(-)
MLVVVVVRVTRCRHIINQTDVVNAEFTRTFHCVMWFGNTQCLLILIMRRCNILVCFFLMMLDITRRSGHGARVDAKSHLQFILGILVQIKRMQSTMIRTRRFRCRRRRQGRLLLRVVVMHARRTSTINDRFSKRMQVFKQTLCVLFIKIELIHVFNIGVVIAIVFVFMIVVLLMMMMFDVCLRCRLHHLQLVIMLRQRRLA